MNAVCRHGPEGTVRFKPSCQQSRIEDPSKSSHRNPSSQAPAPVNCSISSIATTPRTGSSRTFTYDSNGNRKDKELYLYIYDKRNRLITADAGPDTVRSIYDYTGRWVAKVTGDRVVRYFADGFELDRNNDANMPAGNGRSRKYISVDGLRVAVRDSQVTGGMANVSGPVPGIVLASAPGSSGGLVIGVRSPALQGGLSLGSLVLFGVVLLPLRGRGSRKRWVRGIRVSGLTLVILVGSAPLPWAAVPIGPTTAFAGGSGGGGGTPSTFVEHYHHDRLGSTMTVTHASGLVLQHIRYDAYGKVRGYYSSSGAPLQTPRTKFEFTTYESDIGTGLQYAGARFYDPEYGMFLNLDPARQDANPYGYAGWNPVNATDPNGEFWEFVAAALLAGYLVGYTVSYAAALIGGASSSEAARAAHLGGLVSAAMSVILAPVMSPVVSSLASFYAGGEAATLGTQLAAVGTLSAPSAAIGAANGDWSGVISLGLSTAIIVAGYAGLTQAGNAEGGGDDLGDAPQLAGGNADTEAQAVAQAHAHDMSFDGTTLRMYDQQGNVIREWPAASGRPGYQSSTFQSVADHGPIPEGFYVAKQSALQSRPTGLFDRGLQAVGRGTWPGGQPAWGDYRVWLNPIRGTNTFGRTNFSIHGGWFPGSAGCIDLCGGMGSFVEAFKATGRDLVLRVRY